MESFEIVLSSGSPAQLAVSHMSNKTRKTKSLLTWLRQHGPRARTNPLVYTQKQGWRRESLEKENGIPWSVGTKMPRQVLYDPCECTKSERYIENRLVCMCLAKASDPNNNKQGY